MKSKDQWRVSDELWVRIEALLPVHEPKAHPLGCHRKRVDDRKVMDGIFFVMRTGCPWKALDATGICSGSTAHARFQEWEKAGLFKRLWEEALLEYDQEKGLKWKWMSMDGAMTKAPLGGEKNRAQSNRPRQAWSQAQSADRSARHARGPGHRRGQPQRHETHSSHP